MVCLNIYIYIFYPYFLNRFAIWLRCWDLGLKQFVWHCHCSSSVTLQHLIQLQFDKFHHISLKEIWLYHHRSMAITLISAFISIVWSIHNLLQSFFTKYFSVLHFLYIVISVFVIFSYCFPPKIYKQIQFVWPGRSLPWSGPVPFHLFKVHTCSFNSRSGYACIFLNQYIILLLSIAAA